MLLILSAVGRRWLAVLLCGTAGLAAGCLPARTSVVPSDPAMTSRPAPEEAKFDAPLRHRLRTGAERPVTVLLQLEGPPAEAPALLGEAGLCLRSTVGALVTAEGIPEAIRRAARYGFVRHIALSQQQSPSSPE